MASSMSAANSAGQRVRGITKGKSTARIFKQTGQKIPVKVDEQFNAFVGGSASKVSTALGIEIREKAPVEGVSKWGDIDQVIKDSIVQGVLDWLHIEGYGNNDLATEVVNAKCQSLYRCWKSRAKRYYDKLLAEGIDPYAHCYPSMEYTKWKHMIENVWTTESIKKRSEINKASRTHVTYNHTMGSKSFASELYAMTIKAKEDQMQPKISEFYKLSHKRSIKKGGDWIDQCCEEDFVAIEQLENELITNGEEIIAPEEISQTIFGKRNYLKGLGPSMKSSSKMKFNGESNCHHRNDFQVLNTEVGTLRNIRQEYEEKFESQAEMIESQNRKIEELANRHTRFINMFLGGGSLTDLISSQGPNVNSGI